MLVAFEVSCWFTSPVPLVSDEESVLTWNSFYEANDFEQETINLMLSILVAHSTAKGPAGTLLVTAVLEIFMSVLKTHADTTDKEWYLRLLPKISRPTMINTFFHVRALSTRSPTAPLSCSLSYSFLPIPH